MPVPLSPESAVSIVGPTAIGKTAVAMELAKLLGQRAEILSVDSVQVYRHLDIGSAKPTPEEREKFVFYLLDLVDPDQPFTLADYQAAADTAYRQTLSRGNMAILAGGTGLYFRSLTQPLNLPGVPPDEPLRAALFAEEHENGAGTLHKRLSAVDPDAAARLHPNDTKRIVRALEVIQHTQAKISDLHTRDAAQGEPLIPCARCFALNCDRAVLYDRIEKRVDLMMQSGFLEEVQHLRGRGYSPDLRAMRGLGYAELNAYIDGQLDLPSAVALIKQRTRQFARRQLIWYRADPRLIWLDAPPTRAAQEIAQEIYSRIHAR